MFYKHSIIIIIFATNERILANIESFKIQIENVD